MATLSYSDLQTRIANLSSEDAYLVGLFDGEGSISVLLDEYAGRNQSYVCCRLGMADRRPVALLQKRFGGKVILDVRPTPHLTLFVWYAYGSHARPLLAILQQHSLIKHEQAAIAIRAIELLEASKARRKKPRIGTGCIPPDELLERRSLTQRVKALNRAS